VTAGPSDPPGGGIPCAVCGRAGRLVPAFPLSGRCDAHATTFVEGEVAAMASEDLEDLLAHLTCLVMEEWEEAGEVAAGGSSEGSATPPGPGLPRP